MATSGDLHWDEPHFNEILILGSRVFDPSLSFNLWSSNLLATIAEIWDCDPLETPRRLPTVVRNILHSPSATRTPLVPTAWPPARINFRRDPREEGRNFPADNEYDPFLDQAEASSETRASARAEENGGSGSPSIRGMPSSASRADFDVEHAVPEFGSYGAREYLQPGLLEPEMGQVPGSFGLPFVQEPFWIVAQPPFSDQIASFSSPGHASFVPYAFPDQVAAGHSSSSSSFGEGRHAGEGSSQPETPMQQAEEHQRPESRSAVSEPRVRSAPVVSSSSASSRTPSPERRANVASFRSRRSSVTATASSSAAPSVVPRSEAGIERRAGHSARPEHEPALALRLRQQHQFEQRRTAMLQSATAQAFIPYQRPTGSSWIERQPHSQPQPQSSHPHRRASSRGAIDQLLSHSRIHPRPQAFVPIQQESLSRHRLFPGPGSASGSASRSASRAGSTGRRSSSSGASTVTAGSSATVTESNTRETSQRERERESPRQGTSGSGGSSTGDHPRARASENASSTTGGSTRPVFRRILQRGQPEP